MSKLVIHVRNENDEKVAYENNFLPVSKYIEYLEMQAKIEDKDEPMSEAEKMNIQLDFVAGLFEGLTRERMSSGLNMAELNQIFADVFVELIGGNPDPKAD